MSDGQVTLYGAYPSLALLSPPKMLSRRPRTFLPERCAAITASLMARACAGVNSKEGAAFVTGAESAASATRAAEVSKCIFFLGFSGWWSETAVDALG